MRAISYRGLTRDSPQAAIPHTAIRQKGTRDQCVSATRTLRLRIRPNLGVMNGHTVQFLFVDHKLRLLNLVEAAEKAIAASTYRDGEQLYMSRV